MIRVYNFESTAYRLFCELEQYLLSSIRLESIRFLSYIEEAHSFNMRMEIPSCP